MTTPSEVLSDVLQEFENVYGHSLYSALPNSKTSTGKSGSGTTNKEILYAQVKADLLKGITKSLGGEGNSPLAVTQLIMSNIANNIEVSKSTATGKQAAGSTRKPQPTLKINYGRNTGIDSEANAISGVLTSGVTGSLAKRATQVDESSVQSEGLMTPQQLAIRNNPNGFFKADRVWKGETFKKGEAKPPAYLSAFGPTGNPQAGFKGPPTITNALDSTSTGFTDNGPSEVEISPQEITNQLNVMYPPNDNGEHNWTLRGYTPAPDGGGWMIVYDIINNVEHTVDIINGTVMRIDPDTQRKSWDKAQAAIDATNAANNATPNIVPIRSSDFNTDNNGKLFYWDPNTSKLMVQNEKGNFVVGQPDLTPAADGIQWITYTDKEGTWQQDANDPKNRTKVGASADTARFVDGRLIDTKTR